MDTAAARIRQRIKRLGVAEVRPELFARLVADEARRLRARWLGVGVGVVLALAGYFVTRPWRSGEPVAATVIVAAFTVIAVTAMADVIVSLRSVPATLDPDRRIARLRSVTPADYLAPTVIWLSRGLAAVAVLATLGAFALTRTGHFDLPTFVRGGGPIAALLAAVLLVIFEVTARRVVDQPEPASADDELLWGDARRADVLAHLASPVGVMSFGALLLLSLSLDPAASAAALRAPGDSPEWVMALSVAGLIGSQAAVAMFALATVIIDRTQPTWFIRRLWPERIGAPV